MWLRDGVAGHARTAESLIAFAFVGFASPLAADAQPVGRHLMRAGTMRAILTPIATIPGLVLTTWLLDLVGSDVPTAA